MTDNLPPDDRELEQYLAGDSKLSRRYREASREGAPPELDEAILAQARAELKRKPPSLNRMLAPFALAASVLLGVNLAWNLWQVEPAPVQTSPAEGKLQSRDDAFVPAPPPAANEPQRLNLKEERAAETDALARHDAELAQQREQESLRKRQSQSQSEERAVMAQRRAEAPAAPEVQSFAAEPSMGAAAAPQAKALADAAPALSEAQKVDRLIAHVGGLQDAVFIRNGKEYGPAEAAKHLQLKREKAGDRVRTADDFIRLCAAHSSVSGDAYLIRFADGRTRTAEDVLREELARLESR